MKFKGSSRLMSIANNRCLHHFKRHGRSHYHAHQSSVALEVENHGPIDITEIESTFPIYKVLPLENGYLPRKLPSSSPFSQFRGSKLNVTDIATKYCELQTLYDLCNGGREETEAMTAGTSVHLTLEKEAAKNLPGVPVELPLVLSKSEKLAKKFIEMINRIEALLLGHSVREFYVFQVIDDILITGYIDEISVNSGNQLMISDTKSRIKGNLPPVSQRLSAYHQLLVYHKLFSSLMNPSSSSPFPQLYSIFRVDPYEPFSDEFLAAVEGTNIPSTLSELESVLNRSFKKLSEQTTVSSEVQVAYHRSKGPLTGSLIDTCRYSYSEQTFQELKNFSLTFWRGEREAIGVDPSEHIKCRHCPMSNHCEWRATMDAVIV